MTDRRPLPSLVALLVLAALLNPAPSHAQGPCGVVDAIDFPVDPDHFFVVYPYGLPSSRFDGRYHAGEDWFSGRATTYGAPVRAIARGRVTYSEPLGWGRDKGVVIIEHLMPDGTLWYSLYGHMEEAEGAAFPSVYTCVNRGDVVGAIGRPRPAPHLHLEIRNFGPDSPGPGYWGTDPTLSGWRNPSKFIVNWQAWLNPAHRWHADIADETGPRWPGIIRADGGTIVYDDGRLKALNPSGQVLWRYILPEDLTVVGVLAEGDNVLVAGYDGRLQLWSQQGGFVEGWQLPHNINAAPLRWGDLLVVHTPEEQVIAYGPDRAERWRVPDVPYVVDMQATDQLLAVQAGRGTLAFIRPDGVVLGRATLRGAGDLAPAPDGGFYLRSRYSLWRVDPAGAWHWLNDAPDVTRGSSALHSLPDGRFYLFSGSRERILHAYDAQGQPRWSVPLVELLGQPFILAGGEALLLADGFGAALVVGAESGALCSQARVWGWRAAGAWAGLGGDGVLRLHVADQVIGLDWASLAAGCR